MNHILKFRNQNRNSFYIIAKLRNLFHFTQKGQNFVISRDLKLSVGKNKILKAVCLSFDVS